MSHTLHRRGTAENLSNDYVVLAMSAKGINEEGSAAKLREFLRLARRHNPVNMGDMRTGNMYQVDVEEIIARVRDTSIVHAVFTDIEAVTEFLREVKEAELGMSVVVSGLFEPVRECCRRIGMRPAPHSVEHSLGIWGRTERLPEERVLEIATMCGHGMVSFNLVREAIEDVREGRVTPKEAALRLTLPCVCGVFNPVRAAQLLEALTAGTSKP
ncbi:MAG TPA: hypothetical protein EYP55_05530 [Anaerolineae bacterium]|nr:hypothetical protein [Anaerolineae bacterium]